MKHVYVQVIKKMYSDFLFFFNQACYTVVETTHLSVLADWYTKWYYETIMTRASWSCYTHQLFHMKYRNAEKNPSHTRVKDRGG